MGFTNSMSPWKCLFSSFSEPGYYEDGQFGIRIENLCVIKPVKTKVNNASYVSCRVLQV